ncbi:G-protein coupled receptor Mth2-like [Oppia nitens]|uniref:G-protein coupled receptor Mth2-like n=1 Tax=Oppia nitens TaxID=1686743 RepID=UPI0023DB786F|nr:G-protein coupled receptor Mth2-like [Oppia nitens]
MYNESVSDSNSTHLLNSSVGTDDYVDDNNNSLQELLKSNEEFLREFLICSENFGEIQFLINRRQIFLFKLFIGLSITCLFLTIGVYSLVPRLRNVPGKCLMSLSAAKIAANLCFVGSQFAYRLDRPFQLCRTIGVLRHYFILTVFLWSVCIAFDCYRTFRSGSQSLANLNRVRNHSFIRYSVFCWTTPLLFTGTLLIVDITVQNNNNTAYNSSIFKPNYGLHVCSISSCGAFLMFGILPIGTVLIANMVYFLLILYKLYSTGTETEIANKASMREQCVWYTKLALILGLTWILSLIAIFTPISHLFFYTHAFSSLQGVIIFLAFTCRSNVYQLLVRRIQALTDNNHQHQHQHHRRHRWQGVGGGGGGSGGRLRHPTYTSSVIANNNNINIFNNNNNNDNTNFDTNATIVYTIAQETTTIAP